MDKEDKHGDSLLLAVRVAGDAVSTLEARLETAQETRNRAVRNAVSKGIPVAKVAKEANVTRDWVYKICAQ